MTENLKIFIAIIVLQESTPIPARWDGDYSEWPWRKISIVPTFAQQDQDTYIWIDRLEINGLNPELLAKNIGEIHTAEISAEVEKIKEKIEKQYSGEIQILW